MKFFIAVAFVAFIAASNAAVGSILTAEQQDEALQYFRECTVQEGTTSEEVAALRAGEFDSISENAKCFTRCFFLKAGVVKDGQLQEDFLLQKLIESSGAEKAQQIITTCGAIKGPDDCNTSFQWFQCFHRYSIGG